MFTEDDFFIDKSMLFSSSPASQICGKWSSWMSSMNVSRSSPKIRLTGELCISFPAVCFCT